MIHTKFHHLTNHELTNLVSSSECSQLEIELAQRLEEAERENEELTEHHDELQAFAR